MARQYHLCHIPVFCFMGKEDDGGSWTVMTGEGVMGSTLNMGDLD